MVVSNNSPLTFDYNLTSQKVNVTFYIQRYRPEDLLIDSSLQNLNQWSVIVNHFIKVQDGDKNHGVEKYNFRG